jgi:hypothetical protein
LGEGGHQTKHDSEAAQQAAKIMGVARTYVEQAITLKKKAPQTFRLVREDRLSLREAMRRLYEREQAKAADRHATRSPTNMPPREGKEHVATEDTDVSNEDQATAETEQQTIAAQAAEPGHGGNVENNPSTADNDSPPETPEDADSPLNAQPDVCSKLDEVEGELLDLQISFQLCIAELANLSAHVYPAARDRLMFLLTGMVEMAKEMLAQLDRSPETRPQVETQTLSDSDE